ncbi:hypothetical protein HGO38_30420 [Rhizobium sp. CG5]|uniref:hypothetical protein n=1 Tax=Rhizobium sp. CG5 TaxID=2726076 RepID=UPI0020335E2D|nr:hypothetical protein [Rhizobium sp. CG5]MCM2477764.1 hypothetical protein [Rhizobium sp. CG5]
MKKVTEMKQDNYKDVGGEPIADAPIAAVTEPEAKSALQRAADKIIALNKKSGAHAYDLGCTFAEAKPLVPEKAFGKWLATFSDYTVRSAWNYISIHERLANYREQLLAHAVMPTVMFELAKGEPAEIEAVIARMADGERIRVKDVREMLGRKPTAKGEVATFDTAGVAGLRKVAAAKTDADVARFLELTAFVLKEVEKALEPLVAKRTVKKGELSYKVHLHCRHAHDLLNSIGAALTPDATAHMNWRAAKLPDDTAWRKVQDLLHRMGGADSWAKGRAFVPWLLNEVVPLLRFVVHGQAVVEIEAHLIAGPDVDETDTSEIGGLIPVGQLPSSVEEASEGVKSTSWYDHRNRMNTDQQTAERHAA